MVRSFHFARLPEIIFKNGSIAGLSGLIKKFGQPAIIITGKRSFIDSSRGMELFHILNESAISFHHESVSTEPSPKMIDETIDKYRDIDIKLVVAIGGGSVLDAGKAISAMLKVTGSVKDYLEGVGHMEHPGTKVPFIAIPTTSGTGSEATKNAVISEIGQQGFKKSLRHNNFVPDIALLDPELTIDCPTGITSASGMDCFTQLTEAFLSDSASDYTDSFAILGLKAVKKYLLRSVSDGGDIEARSGMSFAALNSGICLANAGLGTVHGFASVIGARYDIPHGLVCGTLMAPANRVNVRELRIKDPEGQALRKYARLGRLFLEKEGESDDYYIDGFINRIYELTAELNLPGLAGFGLKESDGQDICMETENKNNPVKLDNKCLIEILKERLSGVGPLHS